MSAKKIKTKPIEKTQYRVYFRKTTQFYKAMFQAKEIQNWDAVGLNAVHCAISACDAMLVFYAGIRCTSENHLDVVTLLINSVDLDETNTKSNTLKKILFKKNIIEYEDRNFTEKEALEILKLTESFYMWVSSKIKGS